jgi:AraC-like DNA-binding protein
MNPTTASITPKTDGLIATSNVKGDYYFLELRPKIKDPLLIAFGGKEYCSENYNINRKTFPYITIEYVEKGNGFVRYGNDDPIPILPGTLFTYGPGQEIIITGSISGGQSLIKHFTCFTGKRSKELMRKFVPIYGLSRNIGLQAEVVDCFDLIRREGKYHNQNTKTICNHLMYYLLSKISASAAKSNRLRDLSREKYIDCKKMIDENISDINNLQSIANHLGIEVSGLCRIFKRYHGISPYQYILRQKMSSAAQELLHSGKLIKEVAATMGYSDPYHFSRLFKSIHGISPAKFINNYKNQN